jgi:cobalt/nickel transport system permease protein
MHIPDGIIDGPTAAGYAAVAAGGLGVALRKAGAYLSEREVPLAALVAAFVFAAQMVNFPVIVGMSGHLLGGVLAAVLVGPAAAFIILSVVLMVQGLVFADGGLSALGLNVVNMALVGAVGGYLIYRLVLVLVRRNRTGVALAAAIAAFVSVPLAASSFVLEFAVGGTADVSLGKVAVAMLGSHLLIGIGEAIITGAVVAAVMATRPDLVFGARSRIKAVAA